MPLCNNLSLLLLSLTLPFSFLSSLHLSLSHSPLSPLPLSLPLPSLLVSLSFSVADCQLRSINLNSLGDNHVSFTPMDLSFSPDEKTLLISTGKLLTALHRFHILYIQSYRHGTALHSCRQEPSHSFVLGEWRPDCQLLWCRD